MRLLVRLVNFQEKNPAVQKSQIRSTGGLAKATRCGKGRIIQHEIGRRYNRFSTKKQTLKFITACLVLKPFRLPTYVFL